MLVPQEKEEPVKHRVKHSFADKLGVCVRVCVCLFHFKLKHKRSTFLIEKTNRRVLRKETALKYEEYDRIMLCDMLRKYCQ